MKKAGCRAALEVWSGQGGTVGGKMGSALRLEGRLRAEASPESGEWEAVAAPTQASCAPQESRTLPGSCREGAVSQGWCHGASRWGRDWG